jgi:hypothetical protein
MLEIPHGTQILNNLQCIRLWFLQMDEVLVEQWAMVLNKKRGACMPFGMKITHVQHKI